jgi:hypothetical protein
MVLVVAKRSELRNRRSLPCLHKVKKYLHAPIKIAPIATRDLAGTRQVAFLAFLFVVVKKEKKFI